MLLRHKVRRFTSRTKINHAKEQSKMISLQFGWGTQFIMTAEDALKVIQILEKAMIYEERYRGKEEGGSTHHVYPITGEMPSVKIISDDLYRMAKLAGKPEEK